MVPQRSCLLGSLGGRFASHSHSPTSPRHGRPLHHTADSRRSLLPRLFPCRSNCRRFLARARLGSLSSMGSVPHSFRVPSSPRRWGTKPCSPRVATRCHARHFYILPRAGRASLPYSSWPSLSRPSGWRLAHSHPVAIAGCGAALDALGDHALACPRSGALARRAGILERAWLHVAREGEGRVVHGCPPTIAGPHTRASCIKGPMPIGPRGPWRHPPWGSSVLRRHVGQPSDPDNGVLNP